MGLPMRASPRRLLCVGYVLFYILLRMRSPYKLFGFDLTVRERGSADRDIQGPSNFPQEATIFLENAEAISQTTFWRLRKISGRGARNIFFSFGVEYRTFTGFQAAIFLGV